MMQKGHTDFPMGPIRNAAMAEGGSTNIACDAVVYLLLLLLFSFYAPIVACFGEMVGLVNRINYDKHVYKSPNSYIVPAVLCTYVHTYICVGMISHCQLSHSLSLLIYFNV